MGVPGAIEGALGKELIVTFDMALWSVFSAVINFFPAEGGRDIADVVWSVVCGVRDM